MLEVYVYAYYIDIETLHFLMFSWTTALQLIWKGLGIKTTCYG